MAKELLLLPVARSVFGINTTQSIGTSHQPRPAGGGGRLKSGSLLGREERIVTPERGGSSDVSRISIPWAVAVPSTGVTVATPGSRFSKESTAWYRNTSTFSCAIPEAACAPK